MKTIYICIYIVIWPYNISFGLFLNLPFYKKSYKYNKVYDSSTDYFVDGNS